MSSQTADRRWIPAVAMAFAAAGLAVVVAGEPLSEISAAVDEEFSDIGPGTDTPLPPE